MQLSKDVTNTQVVNRFKTLEADLLTIHNHKYSYNNAIYAGMRTKLLITCPEHGDFEQSPTDHIKGRGCMKCSSTSPGTTASFTTKAAIVHNNFYNYSNTNYSKSNQMVIITCPLHGDFEQLPSNHITGSGCSICKSASPGGFKPNRSGILYYLKIEKDGQTYYKIGITNHTVAKRFGTTMMKYITIIASKSFNDGYKCRETEQLILKEHKEVRATSYLLKVKMTECFTEDIEPHIQQHFK
jgi:hypothetical protein